jgi:2-octaprenyl-6-methoxyphenol hydroxylase
MRGAQPIDVDVAIVGASHAGMAMALGLAGALGPDLRLAVIERRGLDCADAVAADPRAFALSAGSVALLTAIGIWRDVEKAAEPVTAIEITDSRLDDVFRPTLLAYDNRTAAGAPATWIVEAEGLLQALRARLQSLPGIAILAPAEIEAVAASSPGAMASLTLADGRRLRAGLVVAADGANSAVRHAAGIKTVGWSYPQSGIVTTVAHELPHKSCAVQHFLPSGPFAILPLPGNRSNITWTETTEDARRILALDDAGFLAEVECRFGHKLGVLRLDGPRSSWPLALRLARSLVAGRVALIGDAARGVHPLAGQGLNLGLRDVAALTEAVATSMRLGLDPSDATGLERYQRWRRFDGQASAAAYDALNRLFSNDSMMLRIARDAGLGLVDRLPGLKQMFVAEAAGLTGEVPRLLAGAYP